MEKLGISAFAELVIQMIGVGFGVYKLVGFGAVLHEVWKTDIRHRIAPLMALIGIGAEVLALYYFPDYIWLVMPFSFWAIGNWFWNTVAFYRNVSSCSEALEALDVEPQERPLFSTQTKWIVITLIGFFVVGSLSRSSDIIVEATEIATAKTDTLITETKAVHKEQIQTKKELKADRDTTKLARKQILQGQQKILQGQKNAPIKVETRYLPGKTKFINVNTNPINSPNILLLPATNLTSTIKSADVIKVPNDESASNSYYYVIHQ